MNVTLIVGSHKLMNKDTLNVYQFIIMYITETEVVFMNSIQLNEENNILKKITEWKSFPHNYYCTGNYSQSRLNKGMRTKQKTLK